MENFESKMGMAEAGKTPMSTFPDGRLIFEIAARVAQAKGLEAIQTWVDQFSTVEDFIDEVQKRVGLLPPEKQKMAEEELAELRDKIKK